VIAAVAIAASLQTVTATAYSPCSSGSVMADGHRTYFGFGAVASNDLRMHTLIRMRHPIHGRTLFRVRDRIGYGTQLDVFMPSCRDAVRFGRRRLSFRVVR
jgi:3D (Asp-Asp-Asp) domain-containing protein